MSFAAVAYRAFSSVKTRIMNESSPYLLKDKISNIELSGFSVLFLSYFFSVFSTLSSGFCALVVLPFDFWQDYWIKFFILICKKERQWSTQLYS